MRAVGGLKDTVIDVHAQPEQGTGFVFTEPSAEALLACVVRALLFYHEYPDDFLLTQKRGMATRFTWQDAALQYQGLYQQALA